MKSLLAILLLFLHSCHSYERQAWRGDDGYTESFQCPNRFSISYRASWLWPSVDFARESIERRALELQKKYKYQGYQLLLADSSMQGYATAYVSSVTTDYSREFSFQGQPESVFHNGVAYWPQDI